jgi:AmmeMemoRadiSam system protein A
MPQTATAPEVHRGATLLGLAREALVTPGEIAAASAHDWLRAPGASFVTLRMDGDLRGCIGSIEPRRPLGEDVVHNSRAAAFRDPRFPPVTRAEIPALELEVSVLSPRTPLPSASEEELLAALRPGVDGVYLEFGVASATFLPQVWESLADPAMFMAELKRKAGLPPNYWHRDFRLTRYTVEKFT